MDSRVCVQLATLVTTVKLNKTSVPAHPASMGSAMSVKSTANTLASYFIEFVHVCVYTCRT